MTAASFAYAANTILYSLLYDLKLSLLVILRFTSDSPSSYMFTFKNIVLWLQDKALGTSKLMECRFERQIRTYAMCMSPTYKYHK